MSTEYPASRVAAVGLGYVGCGTAACLVRLGHSANGVDIEESKIRHVLEGEAPFYEPIPCQDTRLNISPAYLKPGFAFGGSCLPKDVRTLTLQASGRDLNLPLLQSILPSNSRHLQRAIDAALALNASSLGVYGLASKAHTDEVRESPALILIRELLDRRIGLNVLDPNIQFERLVGKNRVVLDLTEALQHDR